MLPNKPHHHPLLWYPLIPKSYGNSSKASELTLAKNLWYQLIIKKQLPRDQNSPFIVHG